jgi:dihydrofolate synthase / folylpolyglutamate synthase
MTYARARAELHRLTVRAIRPGLARTRVLLASLDHPDRLCPAVQITGTNGKGSVTALIASALEAAGYRTGRFTSPHLQDERERIGIAGARLSPRAFARGVEALLPGLRALHRAGDPATTFEAWTALAAAVFREAGVAIAVLEVGMGGRLDATTAWERRILSVLTQVSLEHTRELGPDLESILKEKIAIARPGVPLVTAEPDARLREQMRVLSREKKFPLYFCGQTDDEARVLDWRRTGRGLILDLQVGRESWKDLEVGLRGEHQAANALLAALALQQLRTVGFPVPNRALRKGFAAVAWPGRLELAARRPDVFLDGAHNPGAAQAVAHEFLATRGQVYLVAGVMADKDVAGITRALSPAARRVWTVTPPDDRGLPAADLAAWFRSAGVPAEAAGSIRAALASAVREAGPQETVLVVGSLYNIAPARKAVAGLKKRGVL